MSATLSNHPLPRRSDLWQSSLGWQPSDPQWALLEQLYQGILDGNRQINLTRLTQPDDFWEKHLWDSFSGLWPWLVPDAARDWTVPPVDRVIDIGTGAGFPGFPAAIAQPQWQVTLLDSTQKKSPVPRRAGHRTGAGAGAGDRGPGGIPWPSTRPS
jgi:16S rRNA (guanine527-N7)-methyltransferase